MGLGQDNFFGSNCLAWALLYGTLAFNSNKRLTVEECLAHPYLANLHEPKDEVRNPNLTLDPNLF